ncbi:MAG: hypothetical protein AB7R40_21915 [Nitrospiraceae bacterium]
MQRIVIAVITAFGLSACAGAVATDAPKTRAAMGGGMMMKGPENRKTGSMSDMCAKMMTEKDSGKGDATSGEKKIAMMDRMKGCKMMSSAGEQKSGAQTAPGKPADPDDHSEHHPPK